MAQNFLKVIKGTEKDIEERVNDFFVEMFRNGYRISNTKYHVRESGMIDAFIQYYSTYESIQKPL